MDKLIFGATDGIRERVGQGVMQPAKIKALGFAVSKFFNAKHIALGRDTRLSGIWIVDYLKQGIAEQGGSFEDLGILPTPAIAKITAAEEKFDAAIMVTASHNPACDNGIKVFFANGDKIGDAEELAIEANYFDYIKEQNVAEISLPEGLKLTSACNDSAVSIYSQLAAEKLGGADLGGFKLILDAASGAGHEFSKAVFEKFGIEVEYFDARPDGLNINVDCGALYPEHMAAVAGEKRCIGVALDGDADRVILADERGRLLDGDRVVAMLAEQGSVQTQMAEKAVVMTEYSNLSLSLYLQEEGIEMRKVVNGDRNVAAKCLAEGLPLGGEMSGHILYMPWLTSSDGTFVTLLTLKIMKDKQCALAELYPEYELTPSKQWGVRVREKKNLDELEGWTEAVAAIEAEFAGKGRVFTRYSGTENKLRILVEAEQMSAVEAAGEKLVAIVKAQIGAED